MKIGSKNYLIIIFQAHIWNGVSLHCIFKVLRLSYTQNVYVAKYICGIYIFAILSGKTKIFMMVIK